MTRHDAIRVIMQALDIFEKTTGFDAESFGDDGQPIKGSLTAETIAKLANYDATAEQVVARLRAWRLEGRTNTQGRRVPMQRCDLGDVVAAAVTIRDETRNAGTATKAAVVHKGLSPDQSAEIQRERAYVASLTPEQRREYNRETIRASLCKRTDQPKDRREMMERTWRILDGWQRCEWTMIEMFQAMRLAGQPERPKRTIHTADDARKYLRDLAGRQVSTH